MLKLGEIFTRKLPLLDTVDLYFFILRLFTIVGGAAYHSFATHDVVSHEIFAWVLRLYIVYSCLLYLGIFRWPHAIRKFYFVTLAIDMIFIFVLVRYVGELKSSYFLAFYLLVAIHSFYFGLRVGLIATLVASLLYSYVYIALDGFSIIPWPEFLLRLSLLFLLSLSLGLLAEREKQGRKVVEELNQELARKNSILEQAYRHLSIGKLIGEIAEGINSPCGIMALRSEVLMDDAKEKGLPPEFIRGLEVINKCSHQVAQVIKSLLSFSKQAGFEMKPLDLNQLVEETLLLMERESKERGVHVEKELMPRLPLIKGDPYELKGVLINLISNAMDALPQGGRIGITTQLGSNDGGEVVCRITDNGTGIPEEHLERIFNPFFTTKHNTGGVGLGLSTSLSVMKKHNGLITVQSKPGEGSSFSLSLPSYRS